jgi:Domain of unknown function (DUF1127)
MNTLKKLDRITSESLQWMDARALADIGLTRYDLSCVLGRDDLARLASNTLVSNAAFAVHRGDGFNRD